MTLRTLYHLALDPACREVQLVLAEKRLDYRLAQLSGAAEPIEVPQLSDETGAIVPYASVIGEYLEEVYPEITLLGEDPLQRAEVRRIWRFFSFVMSEQVTQPILFEKLHKQISGLGAPDSRALLRAHQALGYFLEQIDRLQRDRDWLAGGYFSFADIAAAAQLSILDYLNLMDWRKYEGAKGWYARIKSRPATRAVLKERVPGFEPPAHYEDPDF